MLRSEFLSRPKLCTNANNNRKLLNSMRRQIFRGRCLPKGFDPNYEIPNCKSKTTVFIGVNIYFISWCSARNFLPETYCSSFRIFVVRLLENGPRPSPSSHWGCWLIWLVGTRDPQMRRCVARTIAMLILEFMKFAVAELDFPDFLPRLHARFCGTWLHFQALRPTKPQRARSDGVGPGSLEVKKDCFLFPNVGWCIKIRDAHVQNEISLMFPELPN